MDQSHGRPSIKKKIIEWFLIPNQFKNLGTIFDKIQINGLHQLIFTPMFLKVKRSDFSEIFTLGSYMLEYSFR